MRMNFANLGIISLFLILLIGCSSKFQPAKGAEEPGFTANSTFRISSMAGSDCAFKPSGDVLLEQPSIANIDSCLMVMPNGGLPPEGRFMISINSDLSVINDHPIPIDWHVGDFTGFYPSNISTSQRGVSELWYGSSAVQAEASVVGIQIHPESLNIHPMPATTNFPTCVVYNWDSQALPHPFQQGEKALVYSIDVQIPQASGSTETAAAYATMNYIFSDGAGHSFWYEAQLFDDRGFPGAGETVQMDNWIGGSGWPIVTAPLGNANSPFLSTQFGGEGFQGHTWSGFKNFKFAITRENFINAINAINAHGPADRQYPADPGVYSLEHVNFNPEVHYGGQFGYIGLSLTNMKVYMQSPSNPVAPVVIPVVNPVANPVTNPTPETVAYNPVYRFYKSSTHEHFYTLNIAEGLGAGFAQEGVAFQLLATARTGAHGLYRCYDNSAGKHFVSVSDWCEGKTREGLLGYASDSAETGTLSLNRYRFSDGDHFLELGSTGEALSAGYIFDTGLGNVWRP